MMNRVNRWLYTLATILLLGACINEDEIILPEITTPTEAIQALEEGNQRFYSGSPIYANSGLDNVYASAAHQHPFATIIGCSDSRVPAELIFDRGVGELFVVRTAGNTVSEPSTMGSIQYSVLHLHVKLIVILGHESCGGVISALNPNTNEVAELEKLLDLIRAGISEYVGHAEQTDEAIRANIRIQREHLLAQPEIKELVDRGELLVVEACYNVNNGEVKFY